MTVIARVEKTKSEPVRHTHGRTHSKIWRQTRTDEAHNHTQRLSALIMILLMRLPLLHVSALQLLRVDFSKRY